jgi:hypothetical protein
MESTRAVVIRKETPLRMVAPNLMSHALSPKLCTIAVLASRGNLATTPPRIESMIGPFDRGILPHISEESLEATCIPRSG